MSTFAPDYALLRIAKAKNSQITLLREGAQLQSITKRTLEELQARGCVDRLLLAESMIRAGDKLFKARPPEYRSAISRYYYAMYHSARAVTYFKYDGDDHEAHSAIPSHLPTDFPNQAGWKNEIKDARERRNEADYEPYPEQVKAYRGAALNLRVRAPLLQGECRTYLRAKGCKYA